MDYPKYKETTDAEKFIYGFKQIMKDTHLTKVETLLGGTCLKRLMFDDGSTITANELLDSSGFTP